MVGIGVNDSLGIKSGGFSSGSSGSKESGATVSVKSGFRDGSSSLGGFTGIESGFSQIEGGGREPVSNGRDQRVRNNVKKIRSNERNHRRRSKDKGDAEAKSHDRVGYPEAVEKIPTSE